jgi:hypothetical protein
MNFRATGAAILAMQKALPGAVMLALLITGCGRSGPERIVVFGEVTHAGQPVVEGVIRFQPAEGTISPVSIGPIKDGEYYVDALGGVMVGTYQVQIRSYQPTQQPARGLGPSPTQLLPEKYHKKSEMMITLEPGANRVERDFHLEP